MVVGHLFASEGRLSPHTLNGRARNNWSDMDAAHTLPSKDNINVLFKLFMGRDMDAVHIVIDTTQYR